MILILALSIILVPMITPRADASSCPTGSANNVIEGCVVNLNNTNSPLSGLYVYIIDCGGFQSQDYSITDSNGHFSFHTTLGNGSPCINPYQSYPVSVNGVTPILSSIGCYEPNCNYLGQSVDNPAWGQWVGDVTTDGNGHAAITIQLDQGAIENVPVAALYSDTGFAQLTFSSTTSTSGSFSFSGSAIVTAGFENTWTNTFQTTFGPFSPLSSTIVAYPYYAIPYYCAGSTSESNGPGGGWSCSQGLQKVGLSGPVPPPPNGNGAYVYIPTSEYLNPNSPGPQSSLTCPVTGPQSITSSNDLGSSSNFGATASGSFRGVNFSIGWSETTSSSTGSSTSVSFSSTDSQQLSFLMYPASGSCPGLGSGGSPGHGSFGPELHIWDRSAPPDFSLSTNPTSLNLAPGNIGTSTLSLTGSNGFNGPVPLTWSAPSFISVSFTNPTPTVSSSTVTSTASITLGTNTPPGSYTVIVTGTNSQFQLTHSVNIQVQTPDFTISASPTSALVQPGATASSTITVTSLGGLTGTVTLASAISPSTGLSCSLNPASVTLGASATSNLSCSGTGGSYTVTVTGTIGSISHSTSFAVTVNDFSISASPASTLVAPGQAATSTVTVTSINSFAGTVSLASAISPSTGLSCSLNPASVTLGASATSNLSCSGTDGVYTVTVTGTYGPALHSTSFTVTVSDFKMSTQGEILKYCQPYGCPYAYSGTANVTITSIDGWSGTVNLSYIPPSNTYGSTLSGPSSVHLTAGTSVVVTVTGTPPTKSNAFVWWTVQGTNGPATTSTLVGSDYWVCSRNCPQSPTPITTDPLTTAAPPTGTSKGHDLTSLFGNVATADVSTGSKAN